MIDWINLPAQQSGSSQSIEKGDPPWWYDCDGTLQYSPPLSHSGYRSVLSRHITGGMKCEHLGSRYCVSTSHRNFAWDGEGNVPSTSGLPRQLYSQS